MNSKNTNNLILEYRLIKKLGEGTFSEVFKAQCKKTGIFVAMKCMKSSFNSRDQVNNLKEIQTLKRLAAHSNVIQLLDILYDEPTGRLALVFELMDQNMYESIKGKKNYLSEKKDELVKLADFGSCKGIYSKPPFTEYISTRWYRAPECLLTDGYYNYKMDIWGVGCVYFEMLTLFPLFPGDDEMDQINKIHDILGTPNDVLLNHFQKHATHIEFNFPQKVGIGIIKFLSHVSAECQDLINKMLTYNPEERISAKQALNHPYFKELKKQEEKLMKMSTLSNINLLKSFHQENVSTIKGVDESDIKSKKGNKFYLPDIDNKLSTRILELDDSHYDNNEDIEQNNHKITTIKLPNINLNKPVVLDALKNSGSNNFGGDYKLMKHNLSNHSIEHTNNNTQYSKKLKKINFKKDQFKELKKNYISPYAQKIMSNNLKIS